MADSNTSAGPHTSAPSTAATDTTAAEGGPEELPCPSRDNPRTVATDEMSDAAAEKEAGTQQSSVRQNSVRFVLPAAVCGLVVMLLGTAVALRQTRLDINQARQAVADRSTRSASDRTVLDSTRGDLSREREQLSSLAEKLTKTQQELELETANRDDKAAKAEQTRIELYNLRASLNSQAARLFVQNKLLGDLQSCLRAADQALNALSRGDDELGGVILDGARQSCEAVNKYLDEQGLTT